MKFSNQKCFMYPFGFVCAATTMSLCLYWCYKYSLNEDVSVVYYKQFYETNDDVFPTASLCLGNPFSDKRLSKYGINKTSYLEFLKGKRFTKEMLNINYNNVTGDIVNYIKGYRMYFRNYSYAKFDSGLTLQDKRKLTFVSYNGFIGSYKTFYKCFGLRIPKNKDLRTFRILLSNKIFPNGERPIQYLFRTFVHLPKQFMLSHHTDQWTWSHRSKHERYKLRHLVRAVEVVRKRNKKQEPCNAYWKEYDDWVIKYYKNETGCNNPYQKQEINLPMCNTQQQMKHSVLPINVAEGQRYLKPCKTMENVRVDHVESNLENAKEGELGDFGSVSASNCIHLRRLLT